MSLNPHEIRQIGRYPVQRFIAEGGMAWVFEVVDPTFDAPRALKMLKPGVAAGDQFRRFQEEARILARLDHPNLVTIYDFGVDPETGCHFYTMTLVNTPPLSKRGVLSVADAVPVFLDVLAGLARLHEGGIVHRDIKPGNILLHVDGRAMLADLGIARSADVAEGATWVGEGGGSGTRTGLAIGTPAYMSPEQARAQRGVGRSSDVFSFGLTMYNALTGHTVYEEVEQIDSTNGHEILAYLGHLTFAQSEFVFHFPLEIPEPIREVIRTACRVDASKRYASAAEMLSALRRAVERVGRGETHARVDEHDESEREGLSWIRIASAAALVAVLALTGWFAWTRLRPNGGELELLQEVSQLEPLAARIVDAADRAAPVTPSEVMAAAREKQASAATLLQLGLRKHEKGEADARVFLENARDGFAEACGILTSGDLAQRFGKAVDDVKRGAEGLRSLRASELAADAWTDLEQRLGALAPPEATLGKCALADQFQAKLADVTSTRVAALAVEKQLQKEWPKLADTARAEAVSAQETARAAAVEAPEFQGELSLALQSLEAGDTEGKKVSYLTARDAYWAAKDGFARAVTVSQAYKARQSVRALQQRAAEAGIADPAIGREIGSADELYSAGHFADAASGYSGAAKFLEIAITKGRLSGRALAARGDADRARGKAVADGAAKSAAAELATADGVGQSAAAAFGEERFEGAEKAYGEASAAYGRAGAKAVAEVERARGTGRDARTRATQVGDCAALDESAARPQCVEALRALELGDGALRAGDAPEALEKYATASQSLASAQESQKAYESHRNVPPSIVSKRPASERSEVHPGESVHFEVGARDPNNDPLRYRWTVDGSEQSQTGPSLELRPSRDSAVSVRVDDGRDGSDTASWQVAVKNRSPKLTLSPVSDVKLEVGANQTFKAQASDPDGEDVTVSMLLDGSPVASGDSYTFAGQAPGNHVLEVRASDPSGGVSAVKRNITVAAPNHAPSLTLLPANEPLQLRFGAKLALEAKATDEDGDPVTVTYSLDGRPVGRGSSYTFVAEAPGSYTLRATATDAKGAVASVQRHIEVAPAPIVVVPPPIEKAPGAERIADNALNEYKAAYESRDIVRLTEIWEMDDKQRSNMASFFKATNNVSVSLSRKDVQESGGKLSVRFDQTIEADGVKPTRVSLVATLLQSGTRWKIQKIGPADTKQ